MAISLNVIRPDDPGDLTKIAASEISETYAEHGSRFYHLIGSTKSRWVGQSASQIIYDSYMLTLSYNVGSEATSKTLSQKVHASPRHRGYSGATDAFFCLGEQCQSVLSSKLTQIVHSFIFNSSLIDVQSNGSRADITVRYQRVAARPTALLSVIITGGGSRAARPVVSSCSLCNCEITGDWPTMLVEKCEEMQ